MLRISLRIIRLAALALIVANVVLYWTAEPAPVTPEDAAATIWLALPADVRQRLVEKDQELEDCGDPVAVLQVVRQFMARPLDEQEHLRRLYDLYAATIAAQPVAWWRRVAHAEPVTKAFLVHKAMMEGDPAIREQIRALYAE